MSTQVNKKRLEALAVGDFHGQFIEIEKKLEDLYRAFRPDIIIQVGDYGFFPNIHNMPEWGLDLPCRMVMIDGNHDNHDVLQTMSKGDLIHNTWEYMPRGTIEDGILYIGGARSIDRYFRTQGVDWWPGENISYEQQMRILEAIDNYEGDIHTVITHDAPSGLDLAEICRFKEQKDGNRRFLNFVLNTVKPDRWFFGHYHKSFTVSYKDCEFRCVDMHRRGEDLDCAHFSYNVEE